MRPVRLPVRTRRFAQHVGRRGAFLAFLALVDFTLGLTLHLPLPYGLTASRVYGLFVQVAPLSTWAAAWALAGVICAVSVLWYSARPVAFAVASSLKTLWGLIYVAAWLNGSMPRGFFSGTIWITFAGLVLIVSGWPEPRPRP